MHRHVVNFDTWGVMREGIYLYCGSIQAGLNFIKIIRSLYGSSVPTLGTVLRSVIRRGGAVPALGCGLPDP